MTEPLLRVEGLTVTSRRQTLVEDLSFSLDRGGRLGLIGESGSGKTLTALAIMGLLPDRLRMTGTVELGGTVLSDLGDRQLTAFRGNAMAMVFQEPMSALDPVMRIGDQVAEPLRNHSGLSGREAGQEAIRLLESVGIEQPGLRARSYPHELSGGQRQRAMIAMALACGPELVIADEPTTALDVTIQAQVLALLRARVAADDTALLLITHDLPVVASVTDEVVVIREGRKVESGGTRDVFDHPTDAYTAGLVASVLPLSRSASAHRRAAPERAATWTTPDPPQEDEPAMVRVDRVTRTFRLRRRWLRDARSVVRAVDGVSFAVAAGETFGIVGESGSGKTTLARMLVGLDRPDAGTITVGGLDVGGGADLRPLRSVAQMVFQDPEGSLDPRMTVGDIVAEPLRALRVDGDHRARVAELLETVALPADIVGRHPHEFSGGQRQRIAIARALAPRPALLVADEPVSALDMPVQAVLLEVLATLKRDLDLTLILISHDLSVVHEICDRVAVLEDGVIVEHGPVDRVFDAPAHPYTETLLNSIPRMDGSGLDGPGEGQPPP